MWCVARVICLVSSNCVNNIGSTLQTSGTVYLTGLDPVAQLQYNCY